MHSNITSVSLSAKTTSPISIVRGILEPANFFSIVLTIFNNCRIAFPSILCLLKGMMTLPFFMFHLTLDVSVFSRKSNSVSNNACSPYIIFNSVKCILIYYTITAPKRKDAFTHSLSNMTKLPPFPLESPRKIRYTDIN